MEGHVKREKIIILDGGRSITISQVDDNIPVVTLDNFSTTFDDPIVLTKEGIDDLKNALDVARDTYNDWLEHRRATYA